MKLLLTSAGIKNKTIAKALFGMVGKKPSDTSLVFIPTASNVEKGDKSWLIDDLMNLKNKVSSQLRLAIFRLLTKKYGSRNLKKLTSCILKEAILIILWNG